MKTMSLLRKVGSSPLEMVAMVTYIFIVLAVYDYFRDPCVLQGPWARPNRGEGLALHSQGGYQGTLTSRLETSVRLAS